MLQNNLFFVVIIAIVGLAALTANYVITGREKQTKERTERMKWLSEQSRHCISALIIIKAADCKRDIIEKLNQHVEALLEEMAMLAPDSDIYKEMAAQKKEADQTLPDPSMFSSDRQLKRAQIYFNFAEKLFIQMAKNQKLTVALAKSYQQELYWLNTSIVADAHMEQARDLIAKDDKLTALSHLKHAKAVLISAMVPQGKKQRKLDQIQQQLNLVTPKRTVYSGALEDSLERYASPIKRS